MTDQPTKPEIVQFDVGGRVFKTSRSLIDQHEDTMLARLVSDTWQENPNKSVFIDRDGDMFAQVISYLRYGSIELPITISKAMFLRDLDFFGIVPEEGSVKSASEAWASKVDERYGKISKLELEASKLKLENDIEFLANYCASKYISNGAPRCCIEINKPSSKDGANIEQQMLWNAVLNCANVNSYKGDLSKALMKFGLSLYGEGAKERNDYCAVAFQISK